MGNLPEEIQTRETR